MERNGHGSLWQPGQTAMAVAHVRPDGVDFASSVGMVTNQPGAPPQVFVVGGFTQLEALAVALAPLAMQEQIDGIGYDPEAAGELAATWAKQVLKGIKEELAA